MKFLGKLVELENIILSEVTQSQKNTHGLHNEKWILAQKLGISKTQFTDQIKLKKKEEESMDPLVLLRRGNNIHTEGDTEKNCGTESEEKTI